VLSSRSKNASQNEAGHYFGATPKVQILENYGVVVDVTVGDVKQYRLMEEFVEFLLSLENSLPDTS